MYKGEAKDGNNNVYGRRLRIIREGLLKRTLQKQLTDMLQRAGSNVNKNTTQRIESGKRLVTDTELKVITDVLKIDCQDSLD